jgi:hypothetical protein
VLSLVPSDNESDSENRIAAAHGVKLGEALVEPGRTRPGAEEICDRLTTLGFSEVFHFTPSHTQERYFSGRKDGTEGTGFEQVVTGVM